MGSAAKLTLFAAARVPAPRKRRRLREAAHPLRRRSIEWRPNRRGTTPAPAPVAPIRSLPRNCRMRRGPRFRRAAPAAAKLSRTFPARTDEACAAAKSEWAEPAIAVRESSTINWQEAIQHSNSGGGIQVPNTRSISQRPGGPGGPGMQPGATILTPTEGVDFSSYIPAASGDL